MALPLQQILALVGKLDDSPGDETPRERFRRFLAENVTKVGQVRDYLEECLRTPGDQYNRALQDLVNHLAGFLGFEVTFGRYQGIHGQIGFDGHWASPGAFHIVVEVKTTQVYAIKTAVLVGYIDQLISEKRIPSWDDALGLYVVGRIDPEIRQLENAIVAEKRTHQLRVISVDSLVSLAELMHEHDVSHADILTVLRPSGPAIDPVVDLIARLVARPPQQGLGPDGPPNGSQPGAATFWLTPVKSDEEGTAEDTIKRLVGQAKVYAFADRTPGRRHIKPGDWICFYANTRGVVAHARVTSKPEEERHPQVRHPDRYRWVFGLDSVQLYLDQPVVIDSAMRAKLEAFRGRDPEKSWSWFVQSTRRLSQNDFSAVTRRTQG